MIGIVRIKESIIFCGPGGVGKTHLAQSLVYQVQSAPRQLLVQIAIAGIGCSQSLYRPSDRRKGNDSGQV